MSKYEYFLKHKLTSDPDKGLWEEKPCNNRRFEKTAGGMELIMQSHKELTKAQFLREKNWIRKLGDQSNPSRALRVSDWARTGRAINSRQRKFSTFLFLKGWGMRKNLIHSANARARPRQTCISSCNFPKCV